MKNFNIRIYSDHSKSTFYFVDDMQTTIVKLSGSDMSMTSYKGEVLPVKYIKASIDDFINTYETIKLIIDKRIYGVNDLDIDNMLNN